jgi:hypothetical protein
MTTQHFCLSPFQRPLSETSMAEYNMLILVLLCPENVYIVHRRLRHVAFLCVWNLPRNDVIDEFAGGDAPSSQCVCKLVSQFNSETLYSRG